ncbi:MAG: hypothetical protein AAF085_01885, partial [Planctomycetota bacterium]
MGKWACECGYIFSDVSDNLPWKAHVIPDQRLEELYEAAEQAFETPPGSSWEVTDPITFKIAGEFKESAELHQCPQCGMLTI